MDMRHGPDEPWQPSGYIVVWDRHYGELLGLYVGQSNGVIDLHPDSKDPSNSEREGDQVFARYDCLGVRDASRQICGMVQMNHGNRQATSWFGTVITGNSSGFMLGSPNKA
jgi:hypothetical protein